MNQYKVFRYPTGEIQTVKQGWAWFAFSFSIPWAIVSKMWVLGISLFLVLGFAYGLSGEREGFTALIDLSSIFVFNFTVLSDDSEGFIALIDISGVVTSIVFGLKGNAWREKNLISRGFEEVDTVEALNSENAMAVYLK
jgi:hypothetical protein